MIGQHNFTQQPTAQLNNLINDSATVIVVGTDGKAYSNKSWSEVSRLFEREPA